MSDPGILTPADPRPPKAGWKGRFRNLPIRQKLKAVILVTSGSAIVLACLSFFVYDSISFKAATVRRLETLGELVANQSTASVSFNDSKSATEILGALSAEGHIDCAVIYDQKGALLARYFRPGFDQARIPRTPDPGPTRIDADFFSVTLPIVLERDRIGSVYLRASLQELLSRRRLNAGIVLGILLAALAASFLLAGRLEGALTRPILTLVTAANAVSRDKNYSLRAEKMADDELGLLTDGFNEMLGQIQARDLALRRGQEELERRVEDRTRELTAEIVERRKVQESLAEREEQYRDLVELSPDAILIHVGGTLVFANGAAAKLFGVPASGDLLNADLLALVHPEWRELVRGQVRKVLDDRQEIPLHEIKIQRPDGKAIDVEAAASPLRYGGKPAAQLVMRDITKRKELDRLKSEFISTVSHELRTPLTSIRGSLGLVIGGVAGPLSPMAKNLIEMANNNSQRLVGLINDILDIEKIAAGKMDFRMKELDLMPLVAQSLEANRSYADQLGVRFLLKEPAPGARALLDQDRFLQIMANLLSNAAKFSPKGGTVEVSVLRRGGRLRISIADHGPGIPEEFKGRIFQKFAQADSSDTRQKGGTGLGLSITRALLERMNGVISFDSRSGEGTTFHVDLPDLGTQVPAPPPLPAPRTRRVLIVEDDADVAQLLRLMIQQLGYSTDLAYTSSQARLFLSENTYDAMTLDLMLPDESGIMLLQRVRKDPATHRLPVIVISAKARQTREQLEGTALSVLDWIDKPIDEAQLSAALREAASGRRSGRSRILHVEDEADLRQLVALNLSPVADVVSVGSLQEARDELQKGPFDLAILDLVLPDGWGMELAPDLGRAGRKPVPIVVFSALDSRQRIREQVVATLIKSKVSHEELLETIRQALELKGGTELRKVAGR
ncbi:MAG: response regulator [Planctomycetaceae bacterium]|nr:response regulator [Planctomycetaceae bacterium]